LATEEGRNFAYDVSEKFNGYVVFEGEIEEADWEDREGFTYGNLNIKGENEYQGQTLRIWFQNEYIMSWKNGEVFAERFLQLFLTQSIFIIKMLKCLYLTQMEKKE